jgi:2,4-dienoyl-CoA reductase-like NADH-dependent reductase (Old Yellow Enzyme family)
MNLFDSFQIRDISFRNRIAVSPMCEYSSEDGFANDWHLVHLGARAVGGAGTVVSEGRISPSDLRIWKDAHVENLARVVRFLRQPGHGSRHSVPVSQDSSTIAAATWLDGLFPNSS